MKTFLSIVLRNALTLFGSLAVVTLLAACASAPVVPTESLNAAKDAIASAEQAGARQHAGADLDEARTRLMQAEEAVAEEAMDEAERFAQQSQVAAELALARTEAARATAINRDMRRAAEALDAEMQRQGDQP